VTNRSDDGGRPGPIGDAVLAFLRSSGLAGRVAQASILPEWSRLVGAHVARVAQPLWITPDGVLFVAVTSHAWMNELSFMEAELLEAINKLTPEHPIRAIRWQYRRAADI
jgi:predicted nucleic acid-binding Zn ribbon protein